MWIVDPADLSDGCRWPIVGDCDLDVDVDPEIIDYCRQAAIEVLWAATGRRYGLCTRTIRPCLPGCEIGWENTAWDMIGASVNRSVNLLVAHCTTCRTSKCSCSATYDIELWDHDVRAVTEVRIDGVVLGRSLYHRIGRNLIRTAGDTVVADLADLTLDDDAVLVGDTIEVPSGGLGTIELGATQADVRVHMIVSALPVTLTPAPSKVIGNATLDGNEVTGAADGTEVVIEFPATSSITIDSPPADPAFDWVVTHIQWSDLTLENPGWPKCQDRNVQAGDVGSWTVSYIEGRQVPALGRLAAGILSCEYAKALADEGECSLPRHIQSRVVDGQTIGFVDDPTKFLTQGVTGLGGVVDHFITIANPHRLARPARAFRADDPRRRTRRR